MKERNSNIIFSAITYVVILIVCIAMFLPRNVGNVFDVSLPAEETYGISEISGQVGCSVSYDGTYTILNPDPQLMFSIQDNTIECIKLTVVSEDGQNIPFEIYTAFEDGEFSAERCYKGNILKGNTSSVVDVPKGEYSFLRVDIDQINVKFQSVELFDEQPDLMPYKPKFEIWRYLIVVIFPTILAIAVGLLNKKYQFVQRAINRLSKNKIKIITVAVFIIVAILVSVLVELLFSIFANDGVFNKYRWLLFAGIATLVVTFVFGYKNLKEKPEKVFLPIVLILGLVMLFGSPIKHICWDLDSHYPWAVQASYPGTTYITGAYNAIDFVLPQSLVSENSVYEQDIKYLSEAEELFVSETTSKTSISHLPAGVFIAVARLFGAGFDVKYNMGRLAYLLVYAFVCYFAIKKIKSGKMILATICLFPTSIYLATNYTYDWCVTAFCILGTAYFVSELQQPDKPISLKDTVVMGASFAIGALPKLPYIILMGMTLFMRKNWKSKQEKRRYYTILIAIFAFVFMLFLLRARSSLGGSGDSRGGAVNPQEQLAGMLGDPFGYAKVLFGFLKDYLSIGTMRDYISNFAYLGVGKYSIVFIILLAATTLTDTNGEKTFKIPLYMKVLAVVLFVGMSAIIATALYISFTPVGHQTVGGCQPRYIIPLLAPLLLLVTGRRFDWVKNKAIYNGGVLLLLSTTLLTETYMQVIKTMI